MAPASCASVLASMPWLLELLDLVGTGSTVIGFDYEPHHEDAAGYLCQTHRQIEDAKMDFRLKMAQALNMLVLLNFFWLPTWAEKLAPTKGPAFLMLPESF